MNYDPNEHVHKERDLIYKEIELLKREKELAAQEKTKLSPAMWTLILTIVPTVLTFGTSAVLNSLNNKNTLALEELKTTTDLEVARNESNAAIDLEKQKHEQGLILQALNVGKDKVGTTEENEIAKKRLEFFMEAGLIPENEKLKKLIEKGKVLAISERSDAAQLEDFSNKFRYTVLKGVIEIYEPIVLSIELSDTLPEIVELAKLLKVKRDAYLKQIVLITSNSRQANKKLDLTRKFLAEFELVKRLIRQTDANLDEIIAQKSIDAIKKAYKDVHSHFVIVHKLELLDPDIMDLRIETEYLERKSNTRDNESPE